MKSTRKSITSVWVCASFLCCAGLARAQAADNAQMDGLAPSAAVSGTAGRAVDASASGITPEVKGFGIPRPGRPPARNTSAKKGRQGTSLATRTIVKTYSGRPSQRATSRLPAQGAMASKGANTTMALQTRVQPRTRSSSFSRKDALAKLTGRRDYAVGQTRMGYAGRQTSSAGAALQPGAIGKNSAGLPRSGTVTPRSAYTANFPDSTRGTAMVSPPELDAASPLGWTPELSFGFPDFTSRQFLSPTIHVHGRRTLKSRGERAGLSKRKDRQAEKSLIQKPTPLLDLQTDLPQSPADSILSTPDTSLPTSVDQQ